MTSLPRDVMGMMPLIDESLACRQFVGNDSADTVANECRRAWQISLENNVIGETSKRFRPVFPLVIVVNQLTSSPKCVVRHRARSRVGLDWLLTWPTGLLVVLTVCHQFWFMFYQRSGEWRFLTDPSLRRFYICSLCIMFESFKLCKLSWA